MEYDIRSLIGLAACGPLTADQAIAAFDIIMSGGASAAQTGGLLMAMRARTESVEEYSAAASVMRQKCRKVAAPPDAIDVVGTGGDGKGTLNISTATAFVVSGCGVPVAKHGNRNLSSRSGAADVLTELGINVMLEAETVEKAIDRIGIGFMMAPMHHPAMRHVMPVRTELGTRTIFNILGPLTNPASVRQQLTGAFARSLIRPMAETLDSLGCQRAWVVHGADGTDEVSICGITHVARLDRGDVKEFEIHPEQANLPTHPLTSISGGMPSENARAMRSMLAGEVGPYRDAVLLNAAAALLIAARCSHLADGVELARESIDSGRALAKVTALARFTQQAG